MAETPRRVIAVGEVMVELARHNDGRYGLAYGGDTFNTAVYLARAGVPVAYATALGDDAYSDGAAALAAAEGVACDLVLRVPGRTLGLYLIDTDPAGERRFTYWRELAPARELFELADWARVAESLLTAQLIYFSGITLSLYSNTGLGRFLAVLEMAREKGVKVAFDGNYRPRGWKGDIARTRTVFMEALKRVDIALPTYDDETVLWGDASPDATVDRLQAFGVAEIVVKNGPNSALVASKNAREPVPVPEVVVPVDTTAAGDSFNATYLAARLAGTEPAAAVTQAHRVAGEKSAIAAPSCRAPPPRCIDLAGLVLRPMAPDRDRLADLEAHQVLAHFERAVVGLARLGDEILEIRRRHLVAHEQHEVRIGGKLRSRAREYQAGFARRRVVGDDTLDIGLAHECRPRRRDLVHQEIGAGAVLDDVLVVARVAGDHRGAARVLDAVAIGGLDRVAMVDLERDHPRRRLPRTRRRRGRIPRPRWRRLPAGASRPRCGS